VQLTPIISAKSLLSLWTSGERLRLFRADMQEEGSFDEAVKGCNGVFHVASSMKFNVHPNEDIGNISHEKLRTN
jgi:hypothetical protein